MNFQRNSKHSGPLEVIGEVAAVQAVSGAHHGAGIFTYKTLGAFVSMSVNPPAPLVRIWDICVIVLYYMSYLCLTKTGDEIALGFVPHIVRYDMKLAVA